MTIMTSRHIRPCLSAVILAGLLASAAPALGAREAAPGVSAVDAIRASILARMGPDADVSVAVLDLARDANVFLEARPDPSAALGKPVRFTLITASGAALPVTAMIHVVIDHAVTCRPVERGQRLSADDVEAVRTEVQDSPIRHMPTAVDLVGARALRAMAPGTTVLATFAKIRRIVEPGDRVTVVAEAGAVEVTATFVAADGGDAGDEIRVVNPDTKRYLRARVVKPGLVEVGQ